MTVIDFEGIDGSGEETNISRLQDYLKGKRMNPLVITYPDYRHPIGGEIRDFLDNKEKYSQEELFYMNSLDMKKNEHDILAGAANGRVVLRGSGPNRTMAYQVAGGVKFDKALSFQKRLHKKTLADLVIYVDITPEESMKRKLGDDGKLDKFERDKSYLGKVREVYHSLLEKGELGKKYVRIDGMRSKDEVFSDILKYVDELLVVQ